MLIKILPYIILFLITLWGLTKLLHTFLCVVVSNYDLGMLFMGIINWIIISVVWKFILNEPMPIWGYVIGFVALLLYGVLGGKKLEAIGAKQLGAEQGGLFILILYKIVRMFF